MNCGTCGNTCASTAVCESGSCITPKQDCEAPEWASDDAILIANMLSDVRNAEGLSCLQINPFLTQAAQSHADYFANTGELGHYESWESSPWFTGFYLWERLQYAGYLYGGPGAEFLHADSDASTAAQAWIDNPVNNEILLTSSFQDIGIGYANYWVVNFGTPQ